MNKGSSEELYKSIISMWQNDTVDYKSLESLVDKLIAKEPYFHDPDIYYIKLQCITNKEDFEDTSQREKYEREIKECLDGFFFSYFANKDTIDISDICATGIMAEGVDLYIDEENKWRYLGFIKDMISYSIERKKYRETGDTTHFWFTRLLKALSSYESGSAFYKNMSLLANIYTGLNYLEEEDYGEALDYFEKVLNEDSQNPEANYGIGKVYYESNDHKDLHKALEFLEKAGKYGVKEWKNYYLLAKIYVDKYDYEKAKENYLLSLKFFDGDGLLDLFKEMQEDLGQHAADVSFGAIIQEKENYPEEALLNPAKYITKVNFHLLDKAISDEIQNEAEAKLSADLEVCYNKLEKESKEALLEAERAYILMQKLPEKMRSALCSCYRYYFSALENEIYSKIFKRFKSNTTKEKDFYARVIKESWSDRSKEERYFYNFISPKEKEETKLTMGQILRILKKEKSLISPNNKLHIDFIDYVTYHYPIILDKNFTNDLSEVNKFHTNIKHEGALRQLSPHDEFGYCRKMVIGKDNKKGLLFKFLKTYKGNE